MDGPRGGKKINWQNAVKQVQQSGSSHLLALFLKDWPKPESKEADAEFARKYYAKR